MVSRLADGERPGRADGRKTLRGNKRQGGAFAARMLRPAVARVKLVWNAGHVWRTTLRRRAGAGRAFAPRDALPRRHWRGTDETQSAVGEGGAAYNPASPWTW